MTKSLAAEIAAELAQADAAANEDSPASPESQPVASTVSPADGTKREDPAEDAFAAGLAELANVGGRYATSEPIPSTAESSAEKPAPQAAPVQVARPQPRVAAAPAPQRKRVPTSNPVAAQETASAPLIGVITSGDPLLKFGGVTAESRVPGSPLASMRAAPQPPVVDATSAPLSASESEVLLSEKMPLIASRVDGPRRIVIGREAEYRVVLANRGGATAEDLVARVSVPAWADVVNTDSSTGLVDRTGGALAGKTLEWRVGELDAQSVARMSVKLIAREGKPIELGIDWTHAPVGGKTVVEVQEPKLELAVSGPDEVLYGVPQRYELQLSNPGTGTAEQVTIHLLPPGKSPEQASRHTIGPIAAGVSKTIEVELTAREAGELAILARATATGGVEAASEKRLFCRKPSLEVDWRGPSQKYAGALGTYYFRVRNPGTAKAEDVTFIVDLPAGFELQATSPGQKYDPAKRRLAWRVGSLRPGDDRYLQIRGASSRAGDNTFTFAAATADRLVGDSSKAATRVIAVADLRLDVRDPKGPLPVGADVVYEIRVKNRGASAAENVNIVALFSEGIEPNAVEGAQYSVSDGRVAIDTLERLAAGAETVIRIRAKAEQAGTHVFRAEVLCRDLDIRLAEEEMTRFYTEEAIDVSDSNRSARTLDEFVYPR
ncbi:MAG: hypothetical protein AAGB00_07395 [Planctomycetota bacterium]